MARQTQFLTMYALGDGEGLMLPCCIAWLFMGWNRIVYERFYALCRQMLLQLLAPGRQDRKDVPHRVAQCGGKSEERLLDMLQIVVGHLSAAGIVGI